jgi:hypothetical protein
VLLAAQLRQRFSKFKNGDKLIDRIIWDTKFNQDDYVIGYTVQIYLWGNNLNRIGFSELWK